MIINIKSKREIPHGRAIYVGKDGYVIKSRKGPIIGYALEDSKPIGDGKHHVVKAVIRIPSEL
jgi:hypothetical protein